MQLHPGRLSRGGVWSGEAKESPGDSDGHTGSLEELTPREARSARLDRASQLRWGAVSFNSTAG